MASAAARLKNILRTVSAVRPFTTYANRKSTKKHISALKRQIAAYESIPFSHNLFNPRHVDESMFKYTIDKDRIRSVILTSHFFPDLVRIPFMIDWLSYSYEGPATILTGAYNEATNAMTNEFKTLNVKVSYNHPELDVTSKKDCFYFFGGGAYEILNHAIKSERLLTSSPHGSAIAGLPEGTNLNAITEFYIPYLHDLVDPTGDVDIMIRRPYVKILNTSELGDNEAHDYDFKNSAQTHLNEWFTHWTSWLFKSVATIFKSSVTRKAILPLTQSFDIMKESEIMRGHVLQKERADNIWIVMFQLNKIEGISDALIKIQISAKLKDVSEPCHLFEMLINLQDTHYGGDEEAPAGAGAASAHTKFKPTGIDYPEFINKTDMPFSFNVRTMNLPNVRIESFYSLVEGNRDSIKNRLVLAISTQRHKFFNHIQRLKYLNEIIPYFVTNNAKDLLKRPYLTDITHPAILSSFQELFRLIRTLDEEYKARNVNPLEEINPICLFDYRNLGENCTREKVEDNLFGNMVKVFSKMLSLTETHGYRNIHKFTKRHIGSPKKEKEKAVMMMYNITRRRRRR
jgi:hypothetical protein